MTDILVVDDDRAIRHLVRIVLELAGYAVCEAADGQVALDHLRAHPCEHVILLDLEMPRMNGVRTLEALASQPPEASRHAVIMITASMRNLPPAFAHIPVLKKPFSIDDLMAMVEGAARRLAAPVSVS